MSYEFGIWSSEPRLSYSEASTLYASLYVGEVFGLKASPRIWNFYQELISLHPDIGDATEVQADDLDSCLWSCALVPSETHLIIICVTTKVPYVEQLLFDLARKHDLAVYDPQREYIKYPEEDFPIDPVWPNGPPSVIGGWRNCSSEERRKWLDRVRLHHFIVHSQRTDRNATTVEIDGLHIDDYPSFFLVLGEAINGPAGYFGGNLDAFEDCLRGDFGISCPFTLIWKNHQFSKYHLSAVPWPGTGFEHVETLWDVIVHIFNERGTTVQLL